MGIKKQINDTFNDTFHNAFNKHKTILTQNEFYFYKIDVLCLFNYIILKIMHTEQYIKRLVEKKSTVCLHFILKNETFLCTL